jgi:hypothetical protein
MQVSSFSQSISLRQFQSDSQKPTSLDWGLQSFSLPSNIRRNSESRNWGSDQKSQSNRKLVSNPHTSSIKKQKLDEICVSYKLQSLQWIIQIMGGSKIPFSISIAMCGTKFHLKMMQMVWFHSQTFMCCWVV